MRERYRKRDRGERLAMRRNTAIVAERANRLKPRLGFGDCGR